jgi:hypothetical protein
MQAGRWVDRQNMTKLIVPFCNFAYAPKNSYTSEFKYWSKTRRIINDSYKSLKT